MAHAKLSPSGAHRWMACPGSVVLEADYPDEGSSYAREGTVAHELAAGHLAAGWNLSDYVNEHWHGEEPDGTTWKVLITQDMVDHVHDYAKLVREYAAGGVLMVEQRLGIGHVTGEEEAKGTSDVVIVKGGELIVMDLKFGMGVKVDATDNPQLQLYALGALNEFDGVLQDFHTVTMVIHQPRLNHVSEYSIPVQDLHVFADKVRDAAGDVAEALYVADIGMDSYLNPGEKQCRFCKAKASCPALRAEVTEIVGGSDAATVDEFAQFLPDVPDAQTGDNYLSIAMSKVGLVEDWCKAVRAETERRLLAGKAVDGWKLVEGRKGNRSWSDDAAAETLLKSFRLRQEEMYDYKLINPTKAEKLLKDSPKRWAKLEELIARSEGKPSVARATDRRPALVVEPVSEDFRDLLQTEN